MLRRLQIFFSRSLHVKSAHTATDEAPGGDTAAWTAFDAILWPVPRHQRLWSSHIVTHARTRKPTTYERIHVTDDRSDTYRDPPTECDGGRQRCRPSANVDVHAQSLSSYNAITWPRTRAATTERMGITAGSSGSGSTRRRNCRRRINCLRSPGSRRLRQHCRTATPSFRVDR
jgi:hypothetical protein